MSDKTKLSVYQACVLPAPFYGSKSWTNYGRHERQQRFPSPLLFLSALLLIVEQSPIPRCWIVIDWRACAHYRSKDASGGSAMCIAYSLSIYQDKSYMENCRRQFAALVDTALLQGRLQAWLAMCADRHQHLGGHQSVKKGSFQGKQTEANKRVQATSKRAVRKEHTAYV